MSATYSYTDAQYDEFDQCLTLSTTSGAPLTVDCTNFEFGTKHNITAMAEQIIPMNGADAFVRAEYSWRSDLRQVSDIQTTTDPRSIPLQIKAYDTLNLRVGLEWSTWRAELYGENIMGDVPAVGRRPIFSFLGGSAVTPLARTVGARVRYNF